jgi:hypothetical protein
MSVLHGAGGNEKTHRQLETRKSNQKLSTPQLSSSGEKMNACASEDRAETRKRETKVPACWTD